MKPRAWAAALAVAVASALFGFTSPARAQGLAADAFALEAGAPALASLRGGWSDAAPFQSLERGQLDGADGLDVRILADVVRVAGLEAHLRKRSWEDQMRDLETGESDLAIGAFLPESGDDRFHYSRPYRWARVSVFVRRSDVERGQAADAVALLAGSNDMRVGVVPSRLFHDAGLNREIERAVREGRAVLAQNDGENLRNLLSGRIDAFVGDRLGVSAAALETGLKFRTAEIAMPDPTGVHFIFSKETVSGRDLARIDAAIARLEAEGVLKRRLHARIFSVVMGYALDSNLFQTLAVIGTIAFALSGVIIAYRENFSFFGALVLSALPAVGGGALRDLLFDRRPLGVMSSPLSLYLVGATVLAGFAVILAMRRWQARASAAAPAGPARRLTLGHVQEICDSAGLAAFTVSGLAVAVAADADPLWLWAPIAAVLSAAGGGILRDVVRQGGEVATLKTELYAEVPLVWGLAFSLFLLTRPAVLVPEEVVIAVIVTAAGVFVTRMAVVFFGLRVPRFRPSGT